MSTNQDVDLLIPSDYIISINLGKQRSYTLHSNIMIQTRKEKKKLVCLVWIMCPLRRQVSF